MTPTRASVGGGSFPTAEIPSAGVAVAGAAAEIEEKLRRGEPAVIGRIVDGRVVLDLRSVLPREDSTLSRAVLKALS